MWSVTSYAESQGVEQEEGPEGVGPFFLALCSTGAVGDGSNPGALGVARWPKDDTRA